MAVSHINENNFQDKVLNSGRPVLVDFYAAWCGPCSMQAPIIEKLSEEHSEFDFYKVDVDEAMGIARQFGIQSIPTLMSFKNGKAIDVKVGLQDEESILNMLK